MSDIVRETVAHPAAMLEMWRPPRTPRRAIADPAADAYLALDDEKDVTAVALCSQGTLCAGADLRGMGVRGSAASTVTRSALLRP